MRNIDAIEELMNKSYSYFTEYNRLIPFERIDVDYTALEMNVSEMCAKYSNICRNIPGHVAYENFYIIAFVRLAIHYIQDRFDTNQHLDQCVIKLLLNEWIPLCNGTGLYEESIIACKVCLNRQNKIYLTSKDRIELHFMYSKAERNLGNYNVALDLLSEIYSLTKSGDEKYYRGATLLRIGKVYQNYLMQEEVAGCFLKEAEKVISSQLKELEQESNQNILNYLNQQYSICLDAIGQSIEKQKDNANLELAKKYYGEATCRNAGSNRCNRNLAHIVRINFVLAQREPVGIMEKTNKIRGYINDLKKIIEDIGVNEVTHVGLAVRYLQLSSMFAYLGEKDDAQSCLDLCIKYSIMYSHYKTLVKAYIIKLTQNIHSDVYANILDEIMEIARKCNFFSYEIQLNGFQMAACNETDARKLLDYRLPFLQRNKSIYMQLSVLAKETLYRYNLAVSQKNEFHDLSDRNKILALNGIINDYSAFIENIDKIFEEMINSIRQVL